MDFKELTTVKFLGSTVVKNSVCKSEDDKIAVVTQKGVNVLDLCLSRKSGISELAFTRSTVVPHASWPTFETEIPVHRVFQAAERLQVYDMMMDPLMYPGIRVTENQPPETLQAAWSPAGMTDSNGCLLATRQNTGSVVVYQKNKTRWAEMINVSHLWVSHLKTKVWNHKLSYDVDTLYTNLKMRVQQIEATSMAWSQLIHEPGAYCWCLLFVAHRDGTVVAWKIEKISDNALVTSIAFQLAIKMDRISHLSWHPNDSLSGMLVFGDLKGIVRTILISDLTKAHNTELRVQSMWDEQDMIAVTAAVATCEANTWFITAVKGCCLVALAMAEDGLHLAKTIANLDTLDITGIQNFGDSTLTLVTQCGSLNRIKLTLDSSKTVLKLECLGIPTKLNIKNYNLQGICLTRNKLIYAVSLAAYTSYDHLLIRQPTEIVFFTFTPFQRLWQQLQSPLKIWHIEHCWDYLELIRLLSRGISWDIDLKNLERCSRENAQLFWWLVIIKQMNNAESNDKIWEDIQRRLEVRILYQHACHVLELAAKQPEQTEQEQCSVRLFRRWLCMHVEACKLRGEDVSDVPAEFLEHNPQDELQETCAICSAEVREANTLQAKCQNGHNLPRCILSMLPCCDVPMRSCPNCNLVALQKPVFGMDPKCLYCCHPLELDDFF